LTSTDGWTSSSIDYVKPRPETDAWTAEAQANGKVGSQKLLAVLTEKPELWVEEALQLTAGERVVVRRRLIELDGQPYEIATSYYPASIAEGTALAAPRKMRGGAPTVLAELGHGTASATEDVEARLPTPDEANVLNTDPSDPVLVLTRLARNQDGRPVELSVMTRLGARGRLRYEMKVN
jgi:DNA-binding GntR family transcriptional regulator